MEKSKIYTRTGDAGYTSLVGGTRVPKTHERLEAYGTVDELNAFIACLLDAIYTPEDEKCLRRIQYNLFSLGADLATEGDRAVCHVAPDEIQLLEQTMDEMDAQLPPMKFFILPGGNRANALAHVCRTVCRRAERVMYRVAETAEIDPIALQYINRLSDYFFLLARKQSFLQETDEIKWENPCK